MYFNESNRWQIAIMGVSTGIGQIVTLHYRRTVSKTDLFDIKEVREERVQLKNAYNIPVF